MTTFPLASWRSHAALLLIGAVLATGAGCSGKPAEPVAVGSAQPARQNPDAAPPSVVAGASTTPSAGVSPGDTPVAELRPPQVKDLQVNSSGDGFEVHGRLVTATGTPIVGAVGDFYLDGAQANLIQSYATDVDGSFKARFTNAEAPAWADLMLHFRGDSNNAAASLPIRKATAARPAPTPARTTPSATSSVAVQTPSPTPTPTPTPEP